MAATNSVLGVVGLDLVASEIVKLSQVETRQYAPGERLGGDTTERLKRLHVYLRDGAIGLWVALAGSMSALLEVFGPGRLLPPLLWETSPRLELEMESRYAAALVPTTTLEVPAAAFERQVAAHLPLRRVAHTLLLLLERLSAAPGSAPGARLAVGQDLIAAFASLSRQTTNRQLRRLARAGVTTSQRGGVDVRDVAGLRGVAAGRRSLGR